MRRHSRWSGLGCLLMALLVSSCSNDSGGTPQEPPIDFNTEIRRAWGLFRARDFPAATVSFRLLTRRVGDAPEGYVGLGWCQIVADSLSLAYGTLERAGRLGDNKEGDAGLAVAASALGLDSVAVHAASRITDPLWLFVGDPSFGYRDLVYIKALAEFHLRRYDDCYGSLQILLPNLRIELSAYDFREELFSALESLRGNV